MRWTDGHVTQPFKQYPQASGQPWPHLGTDYAGERGDEVRSVAPGVVLFAGPGELIPDALADRMFMFRRSNFSGNCWIIQHDGWLSLGAHLEFITINTGDQVHRGTRLGGLGDTGAAQGVHLHAEVVNEDLSENGLYGRFDPEDQADYEDLQEEKEMPSPDELAAALIRAGLADKVAKKVLDTPVNNIHTGKPTTLRTEVSWLPANFHRVLEAVKKVTK